MRGRWWRLLAVPVAMLILVGCSVAGGGSDRPPGTTAVTAVVVPAVPPVPRPPARSGGPLVGVIQRDAAAELVRLDPRTLRPLPGARLELPGAWPLLAVAPDRSVAVLGSDVGRLTVVDLVHLRRLGDLPTGVPGDATLGWGWVGPSRLLLLGSAEQSVTDVLAVDVVARRVIGRHRIDGVAQASARLPQGLAVLVSTADTIGPARLVVADADARLRSVALDEIQAGFRGQDEGDGNGPRLEQAAPGIAADPAGRHLYVVPGDGPVADVDLARLAVTYHRPGRSASPLRRLARWWAPPAEAKVVSGPYRQAVWLGDGQLAVTGFDGSASGQHVEVPAGLELLDTGSWTVQAVDEHASGALVAAGRLLAFGTAFGTGPGGTNRGYGLTVYGPGDRRPVHLFGAKQVGRVQVHGDLAYVEVWDANHGDGGGVAVVDLRSGRVLTTLTGDVPELLVPDRS